MTREEAKEKFQKAELLFAERQYAPALDLLTELDRAYPNQRHILYPMARCLAGLRRLSEAMDLADRIARDFEYGPAKDLKDRLKDKHARISSMPSDSSISSFDPPASNPDLNEPSKTPTPKPAKRASSSRKKSEADTRHAPAADAAESVKPAGSKKTAYAVCIALVLLSYGAYAGIAATVARPAVEHQLDWQKNGTDYERGDKQAPPAPWQELMYLWVGFVVHLYVIACPLAYLALHLAGGLQHEEFAENMKDAATFALYGFLLAPFILIGWAVFFVLLRRHFEMSTGQTIRALALFCVMCALVYAADWALFSFALYPMLVS